MRSPIIFLLLALSCIPACKKDGSPDSDPSQSTLVYQLNCPLGANDALVVVHDTLLKDNFQSVDTNFYLKAIDQKHNTSYSLKIEKGMESNLYVYAGKLKGFDYITLTQEDKQIIDTIVKSINVKLENTKTTGKRSYISKQDQVVEKFLFKNFSLHPYDNFTVFTCNVQNIYEGIYIAIEVTFNFYNKYNTILESKRVVIKALVPKQEYSVKLILNVNQPIEQFEIASVIYNEALQE